MKKHRVFVAINLPQKVKNQIYNLKEKWRDLPGRFTKKGSLHLTLVFLGYLDDQQIFSLINRLKKVKTPEAFDLVFNKICYGPKGKKPRMIWLCGPKISELSVLRKNIENAIGGNWYRRNAKEFSPHITLMRLRGREIEERPELKEKIKVFFRSSLLS